MRPILSIWIRFSHTSFGVYDEALRPQLFLGNEGHSRQGFERSETQVGFGALLEFGNALLTVYLGPYERKPEHQRTIAVPIHLASGRAHVSGGPDDLPGRALTLPAGHYRLVAAQHILAVDLEPPQLDRMAIDLFFEKLDVPMEKSEILVADEPLANPPNPLLETVGVTEPPW